MTDRLPVEEELEEEYEFWDELSARDCWERAREEYNLLVAPMATLTLLLVAGGKMNQIEEELEEIRELKREHEIESQIQDQMEDCDS